MSGAPFDTALNIINDAAVELGLYAADLADPFVSTEPNVVLLRRLLKGLGQDLVRDYPWTQLQKEGSLQMASGQPSIFLPADFSRVIDQSHWSRDSRLPLGGPANAQEWQFLKGVSAAGVVYKIFRTKGNKVHIHPTPAAADHGKSFFFEYITRNWVALDNGISDPLDPSKEAPTLSNDVLWFDRRLLVAGLKLYFRRARGFDTTAEQAAFNEAASAAKGGDGSAPVLSLSGRGGARRLDAGNAPDTGYGA